MIYLILTVGALVFVIGLAEILRLKKELEESEEENYELNLCIDHKCMSHDAYENILKCKTCKHKELITIECNTGDCNNHSRYERK